MVAIYALKWLRNRPVVESSGPQARGHTDGHGRLFIQARSWGFDHTTEGAIAMPHPIEEKCFLSSWKPSFPGSTRPAGGQVWSMAAPPVYRAQAETRSLLRTFGAVFHCAASLQNLALSERPVVGTGAKHRLFACRKARGRPPVGGRLTPGRRWRHRRGCFGRSIEVIRFETSLCLA